MSAQLHNLDPSLRANSLSSPVKQESQTYAEGAPSSSYSAAQPSPQTPYQGVQTPSYYAVARHQDQESPDQRSPDTGVDGHDPSDIKRPRACEACRQLKVKCVIDDNNAPCKRCAKAHRQCIITQPSRKRQKKTDSRVAELEKKIDALTASLAARGPADADAAAVDPAIVQQQAQQHHQQQYPHPHPHPQQVPAYNSQWQRAPPPSHDTLSRPATTPLAGTKRKDPEYNDQFGGELKPPPYSQTSATRPPAPHYPDPRRRHASPLPPIRDCIDRGLIDLKTAHKCFDRYHHEMCHHLPIVVFSPGTNPDDFRKTKPVLFQAVMTVAVGAIRPDLQSALISDTTKLLADRIVNAGEKSMELVQTMQVMIVFYQPPERYEELNFNQLTHMAAVMALDLGMGKRQRPRTVAVWRGIRDQSKFMPDLNAAETRRCWLGCYYMCSNASMSLRRPLLVRWSAYADECVDLLQNSPDALPSDRWLCHIVKAQHISEMIGTEFSMDDPATELSLTDAGTQYHLRGLEQELERWRCDGKELMHNPVMKHTEAIMKLYMHEIAMHNEHNIDDFRPPYDATPIDGPRDPESVTPEHIKSLTICMESAHAAFESFLSMDVQALRALPTHFIVRNSYAAVALIKLYTAISARGSKYNAIFKPEAVKVEYYLDRLIEKLMQVADGGLSKVAYKFWLIFQMLRSWHLKRTESPNGRGSREHSQPRMPPRANVSTQRGSHQSLSPPPAPAGQPQLTAHPIVPGQNVWQQPPGASNVSSLSTPRAPASTRTPLQMLSDAANMNPDRPSAQPGPGPSPGQQWLSSPPPPGQMPPPPLLTQGDLNASNMPVAHAGVSDPHMMAAHYGMATEQMALLDFTSDELMAYGFGDEFLAMNLGWENGGGWAI